jgi:dTDP-4-dehydrorhamnose 3,5-epimerase
MIFHPLRLSGAYLIEPERKNDERGFFAQTWSQEEFAVYGLSTQLVQCSISYNERCGTLRGIHYQAAPYREAKIVRCTMGAIFDVLVDLRRESHTFRQWVASELTAENRRALYCPEGIAHGFLTLTDSTEVFYQITECYHAESARGVRWNDPAFSIVWPFSPIVIATRDAQYPDFK